MAFNLYLTLNIIMMRNLYTVFGHVYMFYVIMKMIMFSGLFIKRGKMYLMDTSI